MSIKPNTDGMLYFVVNEASGNTLASFMFYYEAVEYTQRRVNNVNNVSQRLVLTDPDGDPIDL